MSGHKRAWAPTKKKLVGAHPETAAPVWERKPRRPRGVGSTVNPRLDEPRPPGRWVDTHHCQVCGATYDTYRSGVSFDEGTRRLRDQAKREGDSGGGWRSPGPVLWAMRTIKLERWYEQHYACGAEWDEIVAFERGKAEIARWTQEGMEGDPPYVYDPRGDTPF